MAFIKNVDITVLLPSKYSSSDVTLILTFFPVLEALQIVIFWNGLHHLFRLGLYLLNHLKTVSLERSLESHRELNQEDTVVVEQYLLHCCRKTYVKSI